MTLSKPRRTTEVTPPDFIRTTAGEIIKIPKESAERLKNPAINAWATETLIRHQNGALYRREPRPLTINGKPVRFEDIFKPGRMGIILGPLGSGKTTLLMIFASMAIERGYNVLGNVKLQRRLGGEEALSYIKRKVKEHKGELPDNLKKLKDATLEDIKDFAIYEPVLSHKGYTYVNNFADLITLLSRNQMIREMSRWETGRRINDAHGKTMLIIDEWAQLVNPLKQQGDKADNVRQFIRYTRKLGIFVLAASPWKSDFGSYYLSKQVIKDALGEHASGGAANIIFERTPERIMEVDRYAFETWGSANLTLMMDQDTYLGVGRKKPKLLVTPREGFAKHESQVKAGDIIFDTGAPSTFESGRMSDGTELNMGEFLRFVSLYEQKHNCETYEAMTAFVKAHSTKSAQEITLDIDDPYLYTMLLRATVNAAMNTAPDLIDDAAASGAITNTLLMKHYGGAPATYSAKVKKFDPDAMTNLFTTQAKILMERRNKAGRPRKHKQERIF
ncbi:MAG: hypothetical protein J7L32_05240 [Thermoplasmata archaeon]|nr:hypothetical protein [Thermoplasmata archaeon]